MPFTLHSSCALSAFAWPRWAGVLFAAFVTLPIAVQTAATAETTPREPSIQQRVQALVPSLKEYIAANMKSFDVPGLAMAFVLLLLFLTN